ncbi:uncharacterized protein [Apostichopus japonicus]|uniref:uncharacterized protein isoform X3 n=1 Tax=Stichopus japonicus TaxID=307972 RepID=UPI003AB55A54
MMNIYLAVVIITSLMSTTQCKSEFVEETVVVGNSIELICSCRNCSQNRPVWRFNGQTIFADGLIPSDIGFDNVHGVFITDTSSVLKFESSTSENEGNYSCMNGMDNNIYILHVTRPIVYLLCMKSKCPDKLYFDPSLLYEFNCYSDQLSPESTFIWKVNNIKLNGIITDSYYKMHADNTTSIGSTLTTTLHENVKSVSCSLGDATSVIIAEVSDHEDKGGTFAAPIIITIACIAILAGTYTFWRHKNEFLSTISSFLPARNILSNPQHQQEKNIETGLLPEPEAIASHIDLRSFERQNICFRGNISISPTIIQWSGKLEIGKSKKDVIISYIQENEQEEAKELWKICSEAKLTMPEHPNILKTLGHSTYEEIYCLIQDYYGMTSLDFCLATEYSNNPIAISENTVDTSVGYAYGVIEGMAYLDSQQCYHPGLCSRRIMVNSFGICKLYCFCPKTNVNTFLKWIILKDEENVWALPPECQSSGTYSECSDVWSIGFTLCEIFLGDMESLRKYVLLENNEMTKHLEEISKPLQCPEKLWETLKSCLSIGQQDRPTIDAVKTLHLQKSPKIEYLKIKKQQKSSQDDYETVVNQEKSSKTVYGIMNSSQDDNDRVDNQEKSSQDDNEKGDNQEKSWKTGSGLKENQEVNSSKDDYEKVEIKEKPPLGTTEDGDTLSKNQSKVNKVEAIMQGGLTDDSYEDMNVPINK